MEFNKLSAGFGIEVHGVDLSSLDQEDFRTDAIKAHEAHLAELIAVQADVV